MKFGAPHSCFDSRLTCVDCQTQVCPSCMEVCPVGNRCRKCADRFTSHLTKVSPKILATLGLASVGVGFVFGILQSQLYGGYLLWFALFFVGFFVGKALHKLAKHKLGTKILATVISGVVIGALLSPARDVMLGGGMTLDGIASAIGMDTVAPKRDDSARNKFGQRARSQFSKFETAFNNKNGANFKVRTLVTDGTDSEDIWLNVESISDENINGRIANKPLELTNLKKGAALEIKRDAIDDWYYEDQEDEEVGFFSRDDEGEIGTFRRRAGWWSMGSFWLSLSIFIGGIVSPILRVKVRE